MTFTVAYLWLIPAIPLFAAAVGALTPRGGRWFAAAVAIGAMAGALLLSCAALRSALIDRSVHLVSNFVWFGSGPEAVRLGWLLDPLTGFMCVMVTLVSLLIFVFSVGYMRADANFARFFCFLSFFAAAMLGVIVANSLLLLFVCWELVGVASYLLIGFWFHKPEAAAAAKKAFITTRLADIGFLLGLVWLYDSTGSLLFYDGGAGVLETAALNGLVAQTVGGGLVASTAIGLLIFCGAAGKSGQVPLHVWLPDAMEGPTPVSALIHAATMVAAGVFLMARLFPLMAADQAVPNLPVNALTVVALIGALTALLGALMAVAQTDIKRVLAFSTISQLGYMMLAIGVGAWVAAVFHLITHAFFKALLFLGAGSVIDANHHEQDIRKLGGLAPRMKITFATFAVGLMALAGVPFLFSGFWSKEAILHAAAVWELSRLPLWMGLAAVVLTAFYTTRLLCEVFLGKSRLPEPGISSPLREERDVHVADSGIPAHPSPHEPATPNSRSSRSGLQEHASAGLVRDAESLPSRAGLPLEAFQEKGSHGHESPAVMTVPLIVLAVGAVALGLIGTPMWPWFQARLSGGEIHAEKISDGIGLMVGSIGLVAMGVALGWWLYGRMPRSEAAAKDPLAERFPGTFLTLAEKLGFDELYAATIGQTTRLMSMLADFFDRWVVGGAVDFLAWLGELSGGLNRSVDEKALNAGFDGVNQGLRGSGRRYSHAQTGEARGYLRTVAISFAVLALLLLWGGRW